MCIRLYFTGVLLGLLLAPFEMLAETEPYSAPDYPSLVLTARKSGKADEYRAALLQYAAWSEILAAEGTLGRQVLIDAMRAYYKLSKLENSLDRKAEATRYLNRAIHTCKSAGRESCTAAAIGELERKFDAFERERGLEW